MKKQLLKFILPIIIIAGCDTSNTDTVSDEEIKKDTLIPVVATVVDTLPPSFDTTRFDKLMVNCFFRLGVNTGGKIYFSNTRDSVYSVIAKVLKNHASENSDVVFLIDNTGSMVDDIDNVKKNLNHIITILSQLKNIRVAVALYGDKNYDGKEWYKRTNLTTDLESTRKFINQIYVNGGGDYPESTYDALYKTVDELNWDSKSKRMVLLIGDAPGQEPPLTEHNRKETIEKCLNNNIRANIYPILINTDMGMEGI